ncbi:MAG: HEAT repeat domain-containing protein [Planctomycetota bacterium]
MKLRHLAVALVALGAGFVVPAVSSGGDDWKKAFGEKYASKDSWERAAAVKTLDPSSPDQLKMLFKVAKDDDWYQRSAAADVLSGKLDGKALDEVKKTLKTGTGNVAEVIATAYGRSKDTDKVEELVEVLKKSSDVKVKRACAQSLGYLPHKKGVAALIEALDKEAKNFMVQVHVLEALERATKEKHKTAQDWKGWWTGAETNWEPPKEGAEGGDPEDKKDQGDRIRTTVKGTDLDFRSRGKGRPLLVLPEYGYEKDYFETYLRNLEESNQILYMKLPGVVDFKNPALENAPNLNQPYYPIDRLVDTLEALREELVKGGKIADKAPLAIMGHGITCWVAIRYANKYPKSVSRLVLLSSYASNKAFSRDRKMMEDEGKKSGDQELEHYAMSLEYMQNGPRYQAKNEEEGSALERKCFTTYFGNWQDLEIGRIYGPQVTKKVSETQAARVAQVIRPMGGCFVPDFDLGREPTIGQPTLIVGGERAFFGTPEDCAEIAKHCEKPNVQVIKGARMPMIEENALFVKAMQKHLH